MVNSSISVSPVSFKVGSERKNSPTLASTATNAALFGVCVGAADLLWESGNNIFLMRRNKGDMPHTKDMYARRLNESDNYISRTYWGRKVERADAIIKNSGKIPWKNVSLKSAKIAGVFGGLYLLFEGINRLFKKKSRA